MDCITICVMVFAYCIVQSTLKEVNVNVSNEFGLTVVPWRHYRLTHLDGYMFTMPQDHIHTITWLLPLTSRYMYVVIMANTV